MSADATPYAGPRSMDELLARLPSAVEQRLGLSGGPLSRDVGYRFAQVGGTRMKRDGTVQIGRHDRKALEALVSGAELSPDQQTRAATALANVTAAHAQRLPTALADRSRPSLGRDGKLAIADAAALPAAGGVLGAVPLIGPPVWEMADRISQGLMTDHPSTLQTTALGAGIGAVAGGLQYLEQRSERLSEERAAPTAWSAEYAADIRGDLGISLPEVPRTRVGDLAQVQQTTQMAGRLAELTGSDLRRTLDELVTEPAADRDLSLVGRLLPAELAGARQQVVDKVRSSDGTEAFDRHRGASAATVDRTVVAILEAHRERGGSGQFADVYPGLDPELSPAVGGRWPGPAAGTSTALAGLPQAGTAREGDAPVARRVGPDSAPRQGEGPRVPGS